MTRMSEELVKKVAKLVKLDITGEETRLAEMFSETLDYIKVLDELDTATVSETYQVTGLVNVFQTDHHPKNTLTTNEALSNVANPAGELIPTKGVFDR